MRSSFFEFNVAITGLFTAKGALQTVSHNIANAGTPGYSKQYAEIRASYPIALNTGKGMVGTGSEVYGIGQLRSFYLDKKYWAESPVFGEYKTKKTQLGMIERTFNELQGIGLKGAVDDFFKRLSDLSTTADDNTYRTNVIQSASSFSKFINNSVESLKNQQLAINDEVKIVVDTINSLGQQISKLNDQIFRYELDGSRANDLRDDRARLVDELSKYVNVDVSEEEKNLEYALGKFPDPEDRSKSIKHFSVFINGYEFVNHYTQHTLRLEQRDYPANPTDAYGLYDIFMDNGNQKFDIYSKSLTGELRGLIDIRDGNNGYFGSAAFGSTTASGTGNTVINVTGLTRLDYSANGGKLNVLDALGHTVTLDYISYTYNPATGAASFEIAPSPSPQLPGTAVFTPTTVQVGVTNNYKGIPHYMNKLNTLVRTFAKAINEGVGNLSGHVSGYDADDKLSNLLFFTDGNQTTVNRTDPTDPSSPYPPINYNLFTASNFQVNSVLINNPKLLAAAKKNTNSDGGISNNGIILDIMSMKDYPSLFREGKIGDYVAGITLEMGIDSKQANNFSLNYKSVVTTIDNQRKSVSGVDTNEEGVDMVRFQQLFVASSKLINVINNIYETLINQVGVR